MPSCGASIPCDATAYTEDFPIFTLIGMPGGKPAPAPAREGKSKKVGTRLEGLCFCGSGKPFRECHGKPKA